jgi:anti-sigma regulatory factor (Ser/Thr protein kinase)
MSRLTADVEAAGPGEPVVLRVVGSLDPHSAPVLHEALTRSLCDEPEIVVLDFGGLTGAAQSAVADLVALADRAYAWPGATVVIGGAPAALTALLVTAGAAGNLPSYPSVAAAVAGAAAIRATAADRGEPARLRLGLSAVDSAAATARRLVDRAVAQWGVPALRDTARLVVTELVSNAVRHGTATASAAVEVTLARQADAVFVSVRDRSRRLPRPGGPVPATVEGGRGLLVVGIMSRAWGSTPTADGKVVWASLATG